MKYYIADCHFYHESLLDKMDNRGFVTVEEMNEYMISQWNSRVRNRDEVFILGDLSYGNGQQTMDIVNRLNGKLHLIEGNHDGRYLNRKDFDRDRFVWVKAYAEIHDDGNKLVLCHYPIPCYNGQYILNKDGQPKTYMLYGHVHDTHDEKLVENIQRTVRETQIPDRDGGSRNMQCNMINCFCMYSDYVPLTLKEWIEVTDSRLNG